MACRNILSLAGHLGLQRRRILSGCAANDKTSSVISIRPALRPKAGRILGIVGFPGSSRNGLENTTLHLHKGVCIVLED